MYRLHKRIIILFWGLMFLSAASQLNSILEKNNQMDRLIVSFGTASQNNLIFSESFIESFYTCICGGFRCSITYELLIGACFNFCYNVTKIKLTEKKDWQGVVECDILVVEKLTFFCQPKKIKKSTCAKDISKSSIFFRTTCSKDGNNACLNHCWNTTHKVKYTRLPALNERIPREGECGSSEWTTQARRLQTTTTTTAKPTSLSTTKEFSSSISPASSFSTPSKETTTSPVPSGNTENPPPTFMQSSYIMPSTPVSDLTTESHNSAPTTMSVNLGNQGLKSGLAGDEEQDTKALGIGLGLSCAVLTVVAIVAALIFYRRRLKKKQKAEERRISYVQPHGTDCIGTMDAGDRDKDSLPVTFNNSSYDCSTYNHDYQPYSALENIYSFIPDEDFSVAKGNLDKNTKRTPAYELAKNNTSLRKKILRQNIIKESEEEEDVEEVYNPYIELSNESTDSGIALPDYSLATTASIDVEEKHIPNNHVYNKLNGKTENPDLKTYNVASDESATQQRHLYNRLRENTETPTLHTYNMASPKDVQPKNVCNPLNFKAKQNDLETFNKASGNKVENENQQSNIYDRVKDPRAKSTPGTYSLAAEVKLDQQQQINNKLNKPTETSDRKTYHTASAVDNKLGSIEHRVNDKTKTYDLAEESENNQTSPYNRLHGEALIPDLDSYNTASEVENGQSSPYNRLNEKADMPDLGTYNLASEKPKAQPNHTYNKLNGEPLEPDLGTYNKASGELYKTSFDFSQTLDNENDDNEDSNADYFTLEQD